MNLQYLPNAISVLRLATVPVLVWLAASQQQVAFAWLILAAGLTDILDGWLARRYGWTSALGALLDSIADVTLILVAIYGVWSMYREVVLQEWLAFSAVFLIWTVVHLSALLRYGRLASFHTRLARIGILMFGVFVLLLFFYGFVPWYFRLAAATSFLGGIESLIMILLIPTWSPDIPDGLLRVIRQRRAGMRSE
jgi:CDP-diacylglycerol--glycerol-3-phosphate 3-phosphatidyltransferase